MLAHLCRLAWNRRRTYLLLVGELFLSFLVFTLMVAGWMLLTIEKSKPLGFEAEDLWIVSVQDRDFGRNQDDNAEAMIRRSIELTGVELRALDGVQGVAQVSSPPFSVSSVNGIGSVSISDEGLGVLGLRLLSGRWFQPEDAALNWGTVVIDQELSRSLFGDEDPLGKALGDSPIIDGLIHTRVVGVVETCLYTGYRDVEVPGLMFSRLSNDSTQGSVSEFNFLVKSHPGAGPAFEEALKSRVHALVPDEYDARFTVASVMDRLEASRQRKLGNLQRLAILSGLIMLMVVSGLIGLMWQNVRRRTREIGIRRAVGAPGGWIYGQFLGELAVLVTIAVVLGCVPFVQFQLLDLLWETLVPPYVVALGLVTAALAFYLLVLLCGLYPSWLAAKVRPVEALHHD